MNTPSIEPDRPPEDARVGVLVGDRTCTRCQFNLAGQTIIRERHYGLLIAVCPECGAAAALQEYPLLGRWVNRVGFVLGAGWLLGLLAFLVVNVVALVATTFAVTKNLLDGYAQFVRTQHAAYRSANSPPAASSSPLGFDAFEWSWWERQDHRDMFVQAGGWMHAIDWNALWLLTLPMSMAFSFGCLWSVALPQARRWARAAPMAAVYVIGLAVLAISDASAKVGSRGPWSWRAPDDAVYDQLHRPLQAITLVVFAMAFVGGLFVGRTIARWVVVVFLPPRLRAPWSFLWITDRKPLPRH